MNSNSSSSEKVVRARHRTARFVPSLNFVAIGLAVTLGILWLAHPTLMPVQNWSNLGVIWLAGVGLSLAGAFIFWRIRKRTLLRSAAEIDASFATQNRLEAATALRRAKDPLAKAQREETEQFLHQAKLAPRQGGASALAGLSIVLALAHLATLVCWARPMSPDQLVKKTAPDAETKRPFITTPIASIEWQSPDPETTATAIEEVPLDAVADSSTGLRDTVLEVEVNGEHKLSQSLNDDLTHPGSHTLKLSIYLDQFDVKTYDMVSYYLRAQRIHGARLPPTVSPVQFIQVKPMREDTFICAGGDKPSKCFNYVNALKVAQLRLLKENFALAHAQISKRSDDWQRNNSRVGKNQTQLASRADDVMTLLVTNHYPSQILDLVRHSRPLMSAAGSKILSLQNQPALEPQGKALGYLTEVEKYLIHSIKLASHNLQPNPNDPFDKPKNLELKTHPLTRAGKVDVLANAQARLAGDLASGNTNSTVKLASNNNAKSDDEEITGTPAERQMKIKHHIQEMLDDPGFDPNALKHLQSGDDFAGKSERQIANQDFAAASEPAAEAARELRQTAAALRTGDKKLAENKLADALLKLSSAANGVRQAAQAQSDANAVVQLKQAEEVVREAAKRLEEESLHLQADGATNAAARLGEMATLLQGDALKRMLAQAELSPRDARISEALARRLEELAGRAAQMRDQGRPSGDELAHLIERMQRTQANLNNLASQCKNSGPALGKGSGQGQDHGQGQATLASGMGTGIGQQASTGLGSLSSPNASGMERGKTVAHARGPEPSRQEQMKLFGENLMEELQEEVLDAMAAKPGAPELVQMRKALNRGIVGGPANGDITTLAAEINPPMTRLITVLHEELMGLQRHYRLTDQQVAQAPPAYRPAVADYFEQLSRDYAPDKPVREVKSQ